MMITPTAMATESTVKMVLLRLARICLWAMISSNISVQEPLETYHWIELRSPHAWVNPGSYGQEHGQQSEYSFFFTRVSCAF